MMLTQPAPELLEAQSALEQCQANFDNTVAVAREHSQALNVIGDELKTLHAAFHEKTVQVPRPTEQVAIRNASAAGDKLLIGRLELIWVEDLQLALPARIDTGAETASLDARGITSFERDGKPWVRFDIPHPDGGEPLRMEMPRVREALVIQASSEVPERRPVIELGIQLGPVRQLAEFTLSDRSHLDFQMLVGRNILRDVMLVDVSKVNLVGLPVNSMQPLENAGPELGSQIDDATMGESP